MKLKSKSSWFLVLLFFTVNYGLWTFNYGLSYAGQLKFDGVPVDITTADNEDLVIAPGTGGNTQIGVGTGTNSNATSQNDLFVTGILETAGAGYLGSSLSITGALTANGNTTFGDSTSDTITATGRFASSIVPNVDSTYDLGSLTYGWANIYTDSIKTTTGTDLSIVPSSGNIGIGTTAPVRKLDVVGSSGIGIGTTTAGDSLVVTSKGNVGIGSSAPIYNLDVNGSIRATSIIGPVTGTVSFDNITSGTNSQAAMILGTGSSLNYTSGGTNNASSLQSGTWAAPGSIGIGTANAGAFTTLTTTGNVGIGTTAPVGLLHVGSSAITPSLCVLSSGNVGIGTIAPGCKLDIVGSSDVSARVMAGGTDKYAEFTLMPTGTGLAYLTYGNNLSFWALHVGEKMRLTSTGNIGIGTTAPVRLMDIVGSSGIGIGTTSAGDVLIVASNGNVGIGSSVPVYNLDVNGSIRATNIVGPVTGTVSFDNVTSGTNSQGAMVLNTGSSLNYTASGAINASSLQSSTWAAPGSIGIGTANAGAFTTLSSAQGANLATSSGNVGIGTAIPRNKTEIRDGQIILSDSDVDHGMTTLAPTDAYGYIRPYSETGGGLDIVGYSDTKASTRALALEGVIGTESTTVPVFQLTGYKKNNTTYTALSAASKLVSLANTDTEVLSVLGSGNVGIGTTAPAYKLDVAGDINSTGTIYGNVSATSGSSSLASLGVTGNVGIGTTVLTGGRLVVKGAGTTTGKTLQTQNSSATPLVTMLDNGNVGIGTTVPGATVEIRKDNSGNIQEVLRLTNYGTSAIGTGSKLSYKANSATGAAKEFGYIKFVVDDNVFSTASGRITLGTIYNDISVDVFSVAKDSVSIGRNYYTVAGPPDGIICEGNVGIGTTAPSYKLSLGGATDAIAFFDGARGIINGFSSSPDRGLNYYGKNSDSAGWYGQHRFYTKTGTSDDVLTMTIRDGNVGIGTTAPAYKLDVAGDINATGTIYGNVSATSGSSSLASLGVTGNVGIGTTVLTGGRLIVKGAGTTTGTTLQTQNSSGTALVTMLDNGNVGIGTIAPSQKLEIGAPIALGDSTNGGLIYLNSPTQNNHNLWFKTTASGAGNGYTQINALPNTDDSWTSFLAYGQSDLYNSSYVGFRATPTLNYIYSHKSGTGTILPLVFYVGGGSKAAFDATGNLGIGTTTPVGRVIIKGAGTGTDIGLQTQDSGGNAKVTIQDDGNVGIGTAAPAYKLDVAGDINSTGTIYGNVSATSGSSSLASLAVTGNVGIGTTVLTGGRLVVKGTGTTTGVTLQTQNSSATPLVTMLDSGNVGIGTTAPAYKLDINSPFVSGDKYSGIKLGTSNNYGFIIEGGVIGGVGAVLRFNSNNNGTIAERVTIDYSGNVGIGTTTAAYKLDVLGSSGVGIGTTAAGDAMIITSTGTIGIGTASPGSKLHVNNGNMMLNPGYGIWTKPDGTNARTVLSIGDNGDNTSNIQLGHVGTALFKNINFIPGTSGNVGIGTTAPAYKLDVAGDINSTGTIYGNVSATSGSSSLASLGVTGNVGIGTTVLTGGRLIVKGIGTTTGVGLQTQNSSGTALATFLDNGNVGIGSTVPLANLNIASSNPTFRLTDTDGGYSAISSDGADIVLSADAGGAVAGTAIRFKADNAEDMRIQGGNVGIGSTAPLYKLDVVPANLFAVVAGADVAGNTRTDDTRKVVRIGMPHYDNDSTPVTFLWGDSDGTDNKVVIGGGTSIGRAATMIDFNTAATATTATGTSRLHIASDGNVGIGTTAPVQLLHIQGASGADGATPVTLQLRTTSGGTWTDEAIGSQILFGTADTQGGTVGAIKSYADDTTGADVGLSFWTTSSGTAGLTEAMRIDHEGEIGIGTITPAKIIDIVKSQNAATDIQITNASDSTSARAGIILNQGTDTSHVLTIGVFDADVATTSYGRRAVLTTDTNSNGITLAARADAGDIRFWTGDASPNLGEERMIIASTGNVGIGTTAPLSVLNVAATGASAVLRFDRTNTTQTGSFAKIQSYNSAGTEIGEITFGADGASNPATDGEIIFSTTPTAGSLTARMRIKQDGNVGIGTTVPIALLHVNGTAGNGTGVWATVSDARLKENIKPLDGSLDKVTRLQGVSFYWKDKNKGTGLQRGFIAQDGEGVIPEWVKTDSQGYKWLEKQGVEAILVEAIKEQQGQIKEQHKAIEELKKAVKDLKK